MIAFIKKIGMLFFILGFPWFIFLLEDNPGAALLALILQVTLLGWPFASIWAWKTYYHANKKSQGESQ